MGVSEDSTTTFVIKDKSQGSIQNGRRASTKGKAKSFEDVLKALSTSGMPGRYQIRQILMLTTFIIPMAFLNIKYVFIAVEPHHICSRPSNETKLFHDLSIPANETHLYRAQYNDSCAIDIQKNTTSGELKSFKSVGCNYGYNYDGGHDYTFTTEWDLVCDNLGLPQVAQAVIGVGAFLGSIVVNPLADKYGRWIMIVVSLILTVIVEIGTAYVPDFYSFVALRFISGLASAGIAVCTYVIAFEMIGSTHRVVFSLFAAMIWSLLTMCLCGVAYSIRDKGWRRFQLYTGIVCLVPALVMYFVNESAAWLQSVGKKDRAEKIIKQACRVNRLEYEGEVKDIFDECFEKNQETKENVENNDSEAQAYNVADLFRNKHLLMILSITFFANFTNELIFTGLYLNADSLVGNLYLNMAILAMTGIPAGIVNFLLLRHRGRKFVIIAFTLLLSFCLLVSTFIEFFDMDKDLAKHISLAFFVLGKFANNAGYNTLIMYIPETFPTSVRSSGTGIATSGAALGGILAPFTVPLRQYAFWAPGMAFIVCGVLTSILFVKLPETRGKQLTSTLIIDEPSNSDEKNEK